MAISAQDIKRVKGQGFLLNRGTEDFSGRIITENGVLTAEQMAALSEAAKTFGNGTMAFTTRLTVELPGIPYEKIEDFKSYVAAAGMETGGTGAKVRPVVSCKGTTCVFGLYDTQALAAEIHEQFYKGYQNVALPHKFKIAVGGCPNNCVKPDLNDLGIVGQRVPQVEEEKCRGCGKCQVELGCPMKAAQVENGLVTFDRSICNNCGRCLNNCPFHSIHSEETLYKIYVGGRWGKKIRIGTPLSRLFKKEELLDVIEKAILLFKSCGNAGERFGTTVERLGMEETERLLSSHELLDRKDEILSGN